MTEQSNNQQKNSQVDNLELLIIQTSYKLISKIKNSSNPKKFANLIDKALGVLVNNGVYAYYVYIISQSSKESEEIFLNTLKELFEKVEKGFNEGNKEEYFQRISSDLHKLLFLKQILEKTLIYARYHAKALED